MDEMMRKALEEEFDAKSTRLSEMMQQMPEMEAAYKQYEAAVRAYTVKDAEIALKDEEEEVMRMDVHCQKAQGSLNAALQTGDPTRIAQCKQMREDEHLALDLAQRRLQEAKSHYEAVLAQQGFADEEAYRAAFLAKPAFLKLEKKVQPFRKEYAELLVRCEEIEKLLSEEE